MVSRMESDDVHAGETADDTPDFWPGEQCACQHSVQDHEDDTGTIGYCLECDCPGYDPAVTP